MGGREILPRSLVHIFILHDKELSWPHAALIPDALLALPVPPRLWHGT